MPDLVAALHCPAKLLPDVAKCIFESYKHGTSFFFLLGMPVPHATATMGNGIKSFASKVKRV